MSENPRETPRDQTPDQGAGARPDEGQRVERGTTMHRDTQEYTTEHHDITSHPDVAEMNQRYARVLQSPRVSAVDGLIMLTGLYVAISPWVVHFQNNNTIMRNVDLILGLALAVIGFGMSTRPERLLQAGWAVSLIGIFLIISPWVAGAGHNAAYPVIYNNAFAGGTAFVLGLAAMGMLRFGRSKQRARAAEQRASR
jgi:SPW repeat